MNITKKSLRLQGIIYGDMKKENDLLSCAENAARGGVTLLRIYKGRLADSSFQSLFNKISAVAKKRNLPIIIGESIDEMIRMNADGVHVRFSSSEELEWIREKSFGKGLGVTVKSVEEAVSAQEAGADYIEFSDIFKTDGRREARMLNLRSLNKICAAVSIPVIASGGITEDNLELLEGSGVDGVASNHGIFFRHDTVRAAAHLRRAVDKTVLPQSRLQGAIFDMDGTLLDSMAIWNELGERYLDGLGIEPRSDLRGALKDLSLNQAAVYFRHEYNVDLPAEEIHRQLSRMIKQFYDNEVEPKEGAVELLETLRKRRVPMILLTATEKRQAVSIMERCNLLSYFDCVLSCDELGSSKSHRGVFEEARRRIGTPLNSTWVFEDSLYAVATAKRAGFHVAAVYDNASRRDWEKIRSKSDISVESLKDFPIHKL